jgi:hypothetical protein
VDEAMVVISVLPRGLSHEVVKRVNEKIGFIYSVSCFAMQFSITIGKTEPEEIKLNSDQFVIIFMSL